MHEYFQVDGLPGITLREEGQLGEIECSDYTSGSQPETAKFRNIIQGCQEQKYSFPLENNCWFLIILALYQGRDALDTESGCISFAWEGGEGQAVITSTPISPAPSLRPSDEEMVKTGAATWDPDVSPCMQGSRTVCFWIIPCQK